MLMIFLEYFFRCWCCKPCAKFKDRKIEEVIEDPVSEQTETPNGFDTDRKPFVIEDKQALEKKLAALALISKRITALERQRLAAVEWKRIAELERKRRRAALVSKRITTLERQRLAAVERKRIAALERQRPAALKLALKKCLRFVIREQERLAILAQKRNEAL